MDCWRSSCSRSLGRPCKHEALQMSECGTLFHTSVPAKSDEDPSGFDCCVRNSLWDCHDLTDPFRKLDIRYVTIFLTKCIS